jgi:hypothetical protein
MQHFQGVVTWLLLCSPVCRPQAGDGDWQLQDGSMSLGGTAPPAQRPVVTPASFPNEVQL